MAVFVSPLNMFPHKVAEASLFSCVWHGKENHNDISCLSEILKIKPVPNTVFLKKEKEIHQVSLH